jgi:hypothetical protein
LGEREKAQSYVESAVSKWRHLDPEHSRSKYFILGYKDYVEIMNPGALVLLKFVKILNERSFLAWLSVWARDGCPLGVQLLSSTFRPTVLSSELLLPFPPTEIKTLVPHYDL